MPKRFHMIPGKDIDAERWDHCVNSSPNGLIYSATRYLNAMAENWIGIVSDDYSVVCAMPWKKKFGIRYIYPPPYVQQSGVIGLSVNQPDEEEVFKMMRSWCRYGEYYFNFSNSVGGTARQNFILPLDRVYDNSFYPADFRYDLKKASGSHMVYKSSDDHKSCIDLYYGHLQKKKKAGKELSERLHSLANVYAEHDSLLVREVTDSYGQILSSVLCLHDNKRIYLLLSVTTTEGRKMRANHFLMDKLLQELMPSSLVLDFVGSDIEGVAHYYRNFTDTIEPYYHVQWNDLPAPLRWLKN